MHLLRLSIMLFVLLLALPLSAEGTKAVEETKAAAVKAEKSAGEEVSMTRIEGSGELVGSAHFQLFLFTTKSGVKLTLGGPMFAELKKLEGISLRVFARPAGTKQDYQNYEVFDYEILDVGKGVKPFVGSVSEKEGKLILSIKDSPQTYTLLGNSKVLEKIREGIGGKVWVAGDLRGTEIRVRKFNVIKAGP